MDALESLFRGALVVVPKGAASPLDEVNAREVDVTGAILDVVKELERLKAEHTPRRVFVGLAKDPSSPHAKLCQAVITAFRPLPGDNEVDLYAYAVDESFAEGNVRVKMPGGHQRSFILLRSVRPWLR